MNSVAHLTHSMTFIIPVINVVSMISVSLDQDSFEIAFFTASPVDENIILSTIWGGGRWGDNFNVAITRKVLQW